MTFFKILFLLILVLFYIFHIVFLLFVFSLRCPLGTSNHELHSKYDERKHYVQTCLTQLYKRHLNLVPDINFGCVGVTDTVCVWGVGGVCVCVCVCDGVVLDSPDSNKVCGKHDDASDPNRASVAYPGWHTPGVQTEDRVLAPPGACLFYATIMGSIRILTLQRNKAHQCIRAN